MTRESLLDTIRSADAEGRPNWDLLDQFASGAELELDHRDLTIHEALLWTEYIFRCAKDLDAPFPPVRSSVIVQMGVKSFIRQGFSEEAAHKLTGGTILTDAVVRLQTLIDSASEHHVNARTHPAIHSAASQQVEPIAPELSELWKYCINSTVTYPDKFKAMRSLSKYMSSHASWTHLEICATRCPNLTGEGFIIPVGLVGTAVANLAQQPEMLGTIAPDVQQGLKRLVANCAKDYAVQIKKSIAADDATPNAVVVDAEVAMCLALTQFALAAIEAIDKKETLETEFRVVADACRSMSERAQQMPKNRAQIADFVTIPENQDQWPASVPETELLLTALFPEKRSREPIFIGGPWVRRQQVGKLFLARVPNDECMPFAKSGPQRALIHQQWHRDRLMTWLALSSTSKVTGVEGAFFAFRDGFNRIEAALKDEHYRQSISSFRGHLGAAGFGAGVSLVLGPLLKSAGIELPDNVAASIGAALGYFARLWGKNLVGATPDVKRTKNRR